MTKTSRDLGYCMPSRQTTPGSRSPRRRPSPASSGGWIWLILLATVVALLLFMNDFGPPVINNRDFWGVFGKDQISEVLVTPEGITGEVQDPGACSQELQPTRKRLRTGK